jgi:chromosomal replication initiator protein
MAILLNKVDEMDLQVPSETLSYIAGRIDSNVRDLEGALKTSNFMPIPIILIPLILIQQLKP